MNPSLITIKQQQWFIDLSSLGEYCREILVPPFKLKDHPVLTELCEEKPKQQLPPSS